MPLAQCQRYDVQWQGVGKTAFQLVWCIGGEHDVSPQDVNVFKCGGIIAAGDYNDSAKAEPVF